MVDILTAAFHLCLKYYILIISLFVLHLKTQNLSSVIDLQSPAVGLIAGKIPDLFSECHVLFLPFL